MELTSRELKQIERLRKQERQWPRTRWIMLGAGIFNAALCFYTLVLELHQLFHPMNDPAGSRDPFSLLVSVLSFALGWPACLLMWCFSLWLIVVAIRDWHGNINRRLLLKLLDAQ